MLQAREACGLVPGVGLDEEVGTFCGQASPAEMFAPLVRAHSVIDKVDPYLAVSWLEAVPPVRLERTLDGF